MKSQEEKSQNSIIDFSPLEEDSLSKDDIEEQKETQKQNLSQQQQGQQGQSFEYPDKFSGWGLACIFACMIFNFNTWGANSAWALYLQDYLATNRFPGAEKTDFGIIGGLSFGSGLTFAPLVVVLQAKFGMKPMIIIGVLLQFLALMLASYATKIWHIYCTQGLLMGIALALIAIPNTAALPQWFSGGPKGKRNIAMGIAAVGSGFGGIVYNAGYQPLLQNHGIGWSIRAQAIMSLGLNVIACLLIKSRDNVVKPVIKVFDKSIWTSFGCLSIFAWTMFTMFGYVTLMYNLGDFTRSLGYDSHHASIVSTMTAVGIIYGRPIVGILGDKFGPCNITIISSWLTALLAFAMWIPCRNFATVVVFSLFEGSLMGTMWVTLAAMAASIAGLQRMMAMLSAIWVSAGVFGFASPIIGLALKEGGTPRPEQYQHPAIFVGLCYFMAGVVVVVLKGWLIKRNELIGGAREGDKLLTVRVPFGQGLKEALRFRLCRV
ncbi:unnamed protein product [Ambrosiozyma monospora]|uniref:Unnamed protein product n=1 Tax=Ambrosiozyma monospora TaxID=43982 RepID=A0A9W7DG12_AMBMO|nr:unnamed protein product [Ambrosiozyma monospora]